VRISLNFITALGLINQQRQNQISSRQGHTGKLTNGTYIEEN